MTQLQDESVHEPSVLTNYAFGTKAGEYGTRKPKTNQDRAIIEPKFGSTPHTYFFAIADGHGPFGEKVSFLVKLSLPRIMRVLQC
jgi:serine/threonine protein phosphatase PrpC